MASCRETMRKLTLLLILAAALAAPAASLATATTHGELNGPEYQQLLFLRWKLKIAHGINSSILNCNTMPTLPSIHDQLLDLERTDCTAGFMLIRYSSQMKPAVRACDRKSVLADRLTCLQAPYEQLESLYFVYATVEQQVRQLAVSRALPAACVDTLSDPPTVISAEQSASNDARNVSLDAETQNYTQFEADSKALVAAASAVSKGQQANTAPLSSCPHPRRKYSA